MKNVLMIAYTNYEYDARVRREAETLARIGGFRVVILGLKADKRPRSFKLRGVEISEINQKKYTGSDKLRYIFSYLEFLVRCFLRCTWLLMKGRVDIVHVHNMPDFMVFAASVPRVMGRKVILDIHDTMPETYLSKFRNRQSLVFKLLDFEESVSTAMAHRVICVNHVQKEALARRMAEPEKMVISMNMPDPALFPGTTKQVAPVRVKNAVFRMIYHGTIAERLGVDLAVKAVAKLVASIPQLEFHIWGKFGDELIAIDKLRRNLNLADKVHIVKGGVPLEQLPLKLKQMDLGIIGNRRDAATELMLPVKMLEYISLGIPVVAPKLRTIEYYFTDEMVEFFEPENIDAMSEAILKLYRNKELREKKANNAKIFLDKYGWEKHRYNLINLYRNL